MRLVFFCSLFMVLGFLAACNKENLPLAEYQAAFTEYNSGHYEEVRAKTNVILAGYPRFHQAQLLRAKSAYLLGDYKAARTDLQALLKKYPHYTEATLWLIRSDLALNDAKSAEELLEQVLEFNGSDPRFLYQYALLAMQGGKLDRALQYLEVSARYDADFLKTHFELARLYYRNGQLTKATAELNAVISSQLAPEALRAASTKILTQVVTEQKSQDKTNKK